MSGSPGRPRRAPLEVQRRQVLIATRELVAEVGFAGMTLQAVADRSGYSRATLYDLMGDKEKLFEAAIDDGITEMVAELNAHYESNVPDMALELDEVVREEVRFAVEAIQSNPARLAVIREADRHYPAAVQRGRRLIEQCFAAAFARRAAEYDRQRDGVAELLATVVVGAIEAVTFRASAEPAWPTDAVSEWLAQFFLGGILAVELEHEALTNDLDAQLGRMKGDAAP